MTTTDLVDRLAEHRALGVAPREELAWLAAHGVLRQLRAGEVLAAKGAPVDYLVVVLSGHLAAFVDRRGGPHKAIEWRGGEIAGLLPYSRMGSQHGELVVEAPSVILAVHREHFRALTRECYEITSILVHTMVDRARVFTAKELQEARMEAEKANRAKSEFLAKMSHEIRTPLNAVIGMADVLASSSLTPYQRQCVEVSQRNGIALLHLIDDTLDLSKVESGKLEIEAIGFDLREVLAGAVEVVEAKASAKGLWLHQSIAPGVPVHLIGDPNRLRQVIINLLGNSIKFTEKGGLEVRVEPDSQDPGPGRFRFGINDTGIGIPEDKVDKIFESFSQADSSTTRKYGGTGLGLTISKHLVELMEGHIWVESEVDRGSTFFFTARFGVDADQSERRPAGQAAVAPIAALEAAVASLRILLADDSEDNRFLILSYLRGAGATIEIADNGEIALQMFQKDRYDVVLMDLEMPVMDGATAARAIRRWEEERGAPPTPIYALTAHAFVEMVARGQEFGFTAVLTKPIRKPALLEVLARHGKRGSGSRPAAEPPAHLSAAPIAESVTATVPAGRIPVLIEEGMEEAVPAYLDKRRAELPVYRQALESGDFDSIRKMAHKTKGTGAGFGFPGLAEICAALEQVAIRNDGALVRTKLSEYSDYLERVTLQYSKQ
jgi:signal transduction histidine kinase/HPt (histidine-containing phosphotransfer) domain-containing protein/FixJ family two-component response regulator